MHKLQAIVRSLLLLVVALGVVTTSGCLVQVGPDGSGGDNSDGSITLRNGSSYVLTEVRVTAISSNNWGPNLLGDVLFPNEQLTVTVSCDVYDVLVADDSARECVLSNLDLCAFNASWTIDNATLRNCAF